MAPNGRLFQIRDLVWKPDGKAAIPERFQYIDVSAVSNVSLEIESSVVCERATAPSRAQKPVQSGDTIFATIRPSLRRIAMVSDQHHGSVASTAFAVLRPNRNVVDPDFLFFAVSSDSFVSDVSALQTGASYPAVRDRDVFDQSICVPELLVQRQIAEALKLVRRALQLERRALERTKRLKEAAMQELFTRGLRGEQQRETEAGTIPQSWALEKVSSLARQIQYGLSQRGASTGSTAILRMNCQVDGKVIMRDLQFVDVDEKARLKFLVKPGDLLFNRTNSIDLVGRTAIVERPIEAVFASYLLRIELDDDRVNPAFINYYLNYAVTQLRLKTLASRAVGQANINATKFGAFLVPVPPRLEQDRVVEVLKAIDQKVSVHREKQTTLEHLFRSLLQKLMTGEIRVTDLDLSAIDPQTEATV